MSLVTPGRGMKRGEELLATCGEDILEGVDELSEESDAKIVLGKYDRVNGEEALTEDEDGAPGALTNSSFSSPPTKKENDADSGTASSLSSSPASSSSSDGNNVKIVIV
ncbi:hypothetical protein PMAYCL1PPCAC_10483 [Pristionchus mayeri]|uniref:Uncharacterized protein n=1 Tax=Pristionchus mayeri TaxID=1317129 RepID=A0AAN4ZKX1_9BILA|nr:hypothetical protein PMAYCL1PPCAC_10483 [Pristionchus mayeri]